MSRHESPVERNRKLVESRESLGIPSPTDPTDRYTRVREYVEANLPEGADFQSGSMAMFVALDYATMRITPNKLPNIVVSLTQGTRLTLDDCESLPKDLAALESLGREVVCLIAE